MKKRLSIILGFAGLAMGLSAQNTASLQVIHNSATPAAATVDIYYFDGSSWVGPAINDLGYREATAYFPVLADVANTRAAVAPGNSTGIQDTLVSFAIPTLANGGEYIAIAAGLVGDATTPFNLFLSGGQSATTAGEVAVKVFHGSTNAPAVAVFGEADAIDPLIPSISYGEFVGYTGLPAAETILALTLSPNYNTMVGGFSLDITGADGLGAVVFASGLVGTDFNLYVALPDGTVLPFEASPLARAQVIHNSADPAAAVVDVWVSVPALGLDFPFVQGFEFKTATPYIFLPVLPVPLAVKFTVPGGSPANPVATFPLTLTQNTTYSIIANGVISTANNAFANSVAVNGTNINFNLKIMNNAVVRSATTNNVSVYAVHHGVDAPGVDVSVNAAGTLIPLLTNVVYNNAALLDVDADDIRLDVAPTGAAPIKAYTAPLSAFENQSLILLASGFITPNDENVTGLQPFGLFVVPATGGDFIPLPEINIAGIQDGSVSTLNLEVYPNPSADMVNVTLPAEMGETGFIYVVGMDGKVLKSVNVVNQNANSGVYSMNIDELTAGVYTVILSSDKNTFSTKLIKK